MIRVLHFVETFAKKKTLIITFGINIKHEKNKSLSSGIGIILCILYNLVQYSIVIQFLFE